MELEKAKEQLKSLKKDMKKDTKGLEGIFVEDIQAISKVLQELERLQKENKELECVKKAIKVYKTDVGTENCQFVLMSENEFLNSFNYKCLLDDYISKNEIREKIEELNKNEKLELKGTKGGDRYFIKQMYQTKRNILQDLLKEE